MWAQAAWSYNEFSEAWLLGFLFSLYQLILETILGCSVLLRCGAPLSHIDSSISLQLLSHCNVALMLYSCICSIHCWLLSIQNFCLSVYLHLLFRSPLKRVELLEVISIHTAVLDKDLAETALSPYWTLLSFFYTDWKHYCTLAKPFTVSGFAFLLGLMSTHTLHSLCVGDEPFFFFFSHHTLFNS